ncbi:hypothetical protein [Methylobacterium indicum]|uniref:hypothetical protein n=1 Tax=Methylobacterium indicum TaxID=1775910 RepID=UPI000AF4E26B|nr:hypothetical protein [Methylobacterium indicum]
MKYVVESIKRSYWWIKYRVWQPLKDLYVNTLSLLPTWSTLRTLGESRILKLTVVAPFLGTLILFNDNLVSMLTLSPAAVERWLGVEVTPAAAKDFTLTRLLLTYFGLVFLGAAAFMFSVLCPREIKRFATPVDFIEFEKSTMTLVRTGQLMENVAKDYIDCYSSEKRYGIITRLSYPYWLADTFNAVFQRLGEAVFWSEDDNASPSDEDVSDSSVGHISDGFLTHRGDVDAETLAHTVATRARVARAIWSQIDIEAQKELTDVLLIRYQALEHRRPIFRIAVTVLYALGFAALVWPTIHTFYLVTRRFVGV